MVRRFTKAFVAGIHYARTQREFTLKVLKKYTRSEDPEVANANYDYFVERVIPRIPYVSEKGLQAVLDFARNQNAQAANTKVHDLMDNRFIKELDDGGFIKSLYGR